MNNIAFSIVALVSAFSVLSAGASGKGALSVLQKEVANNPKDRVVQVVGVRGQDQPAEWRVVVRDGQQGPGRYHMYTVQGASVVKREVVQKDYREQLPESTIAQKDLLVDSKDAFRIADREARKAKVGFDSLNYELRCPELSSTPVWYVDLRDARDRMVGRLFISAKNGNVLRRVWFPQDDDAKEKQAANDEGQYSPNSTPRGARHKGYLSKHSPQELPALSPLPVKNKEASPVKTSLEAIRKGMAKIPNPIRGNGDGQ